MDANEHGLTPEAEQAICPWTGQAHLVCDIDGTPGEEHLLWHISMMVEEGILEWHAVADDGEPMLRLSTKGKAIGDQLKGKGQ